MLRINLELLGPLVQQMGMNPQIAGYLRRRRSALTNKPRAPMNSGDECHLCHLWEK